MANKTAEKTPRDIFLDAIREIGISERGGVGVATITKVTTRALDAWRKAVVIAVPDDPKYGGQLEEYRDAIRVAFSAAEEGTLHEALIGVALFNAQLEINPNDLNVTEGLAHWTVTAAQRQNESQEEIAAAVEQVAGRFTGKQKARAYGGALCVAENETLHEALILVALFNAKLEIDPNDLDAIAELAIWTAAVARSRGLKGDDLTNACANDVLEVVGRSKNPDAVGTALGAIPQDLRVGVTRKFQEIILAQTAEPEMAELARSTQRVSELKAQQQNLAQQQEAISRELAKEEPVLLTHLHTAAWAVLAERRLKSQAPAAPGSVAPAA